MENKEHFSDLIKTEITDVTSDRLTTSFRLWVEVEDVMNRDVFTVCPDDTVTTAAKIVSDNKISCVVVTDSGSVAGILTEPDFLKRAMSLKRDFNEIRVAEIMSASVVTVPADLSIFEASKTMEKKGIKQLPVLEKGKLVGIVTQTDLIRTLTSYVMWRDVVEIMSRDVSTVQKNTTVSEASQIMTSHDISSIVVLDGDRVIGLLTERDIINRIITLQKSADTQVEQVMSSPVISIPPDFSVISANNLMEKMYIRRLVVIEDKCLRGIIVQTDIFKAIEKKLRDEEEKNLGLLEKSKRSIYTLDLDGNITYVNPAFMKLLEVTDPAELINQPFLPKKLWNKPREGKQFLKELQNGYTDTKELTLKTAKGRKIYVTVFSTITRDVHGKINGFQGMLDDITPKKELVALREAEKALRENEEKYRNVVEHTNDGICIIQDDLVKFTNNSLTEIIGCSTDEIIDRSFEDFVHPDELQKVKGKYQRFGTGEQDEQRYETALKHKNGRRIEVEFNTSVTDYGDRRAWLVFIHDITKRKQAEETMRQAMKRAEQTQIELKQLNLQLETSAEQANLMAHEAVVADLAKSQFLSNMSHEIRTPMNAIIGFSDVLSEEQLTQEQKYYITIIRDSAKNLLQLINDILDFSKIEAGKLDIEIVSCSLEHLLAVTESLMRPLAIEKNLAFEILQCEDLPAQIRTAPVRLKQCLVNLISNAIKFTEKGHVYVNVSLEKGTCKGNCPAPLRSRGPQTRNNALGEPPQNGEPQLSLRFDVEDTGIGIPADKQESIFKEFMQADKSSTTKYGGTGLGLAITKRLTRLLGGEISLTSQAGKGSVFSLVIPISVETESQKSFNKYNAADQLLNRSEFGEQDKLSGDVLVAEDSKTNQELIKLLLERMGLQVTIVEDGKETIEKALSRTFDLILMDIQMPNVNGYEAAKALRKKQVQTPIIALTAYAMKADRQKCINAGCDDYIAKPINREILLRKVRKYLTLKNAALSRKKT